VVAVSSDRSGLSSLGSAPSPDGSQSDRLFTEADESRVRDLLETNSTLTVTEVMARLDIAAEFRAEVAAVHSRHTNVADSVTAVEGDESGDLRSPSEIRAEFEAEYPDRSELPISETDGLELRKEFVNVETEEVTVDPYLEKESAFTVEEEVRASAVSWADGIELMAAHQKDARNTTLHLEREAPDGTEVFEKEAENSWMASDQKRFFAQLKAMFRETVGGTRPSGGECVGQFEDPEIGLMTRGASATPDGEHVSPVDHARKIADSWEAVYHTLRNRMRSLGLKLGEDWMFYRKTEPHAGDRGGGANHCFGHEHIVIVYDAAAVDVTHSDLFPVIEKHVEACEWAGEEAHGPRSLEIFEPDELNDVVAYVASYTGVKPEGWFDRPIEYQAWSASQFAVPYGNRRTRSDAAKQAAAADRCKQRYESDKCEQEHEHGERVIRSNRRGFEFECAECGSPWGVDQSPETLSEARLSEPERDECDNPRETRLRRSWPSADAAGKVGVTHAVRDLWPRIARLMEREDGLTVPRIAGRLNANPDAVKQIVEWIESGCELSDVIGFDRGESTGWRLTEIIVEDESHRVESQGGISTETLDLPTKRMIENTRLRFHGETETPKIVCSAGGDEFATYEPKQAARWLYDRIGDAPEIADECLRFTRHGDPVPDEFESAFTHTA
jgi:hypothetical protein